MKNTILATIVLLVIVGGAAFFAGMKYQQSKQRSFSGQFGGPWETRTGQRQFQGNQAGLRPVSGEIISSDADSIAVKLQDGSSKIVLLSDKTEINKAVSTAKEDLKVGERVAVFGQENPDGSVTAQSIQLNPQFREPSPNP